ncbi:MAG: hypothetical protein QM763_01985 [Agriterribacter sp.]
MKVYNNGNGYYDISQHDLTEIMLLGSNMSIRFVNKVNKNEGFFVKIENVIAFSDRIGGKSVALLRVDEDGSSFGLDVALRLGNDRFQNFKLLYLFEDFQHSSFVLRVLAENISINNMKVGIDSWPY